MSTNLTRTAFRLAFTIQRHRPDKFTRANLRVPSGLAVNSFDRAFRQLTVRGVIVAVEGGKRRPATRSGRGRPARLYRVDYEKLEAIAFDRYVTLAERREVSRYARGGRIDDSIGLLFYFGKERPNEAKVRARAFRRLLRAEARYFGKSADRMSRWSLPRMRKEFSALLADLNSLAHVLMPERSLLVIGPGLDQTLPRQDDLEEWNPKKRNPEGVQD